MSKTLYLECTSGISGDMTAAALLDLGADEGVLRRALNSLPLEGASVRISRVKKAGIDVCDFSVLLDHEHENHDHDMNYLYGHETGGEEAGGSTIRHSHEEQQANRHSHGEQQAHGHFHGEQHIHGHSHGEQHIHSHSHEHRGLKEILAVIEAADMTQRAREIARRIFTILGEAEAKAHGAALDEIHFHEVGAVDSIIDILSVAVCIDNLDITDVIIPNVCEGQGTIRCAHGILPVPVPAVLAIAECYRIPLQIVQTKGELVTPTGAAIVAALCTSRRLPEAYTILASGLGGGKREYNRPGILRAMLIEPVHENRDLICKLETNIDDCSGEQMGYVMERLFEAGAKDVHYSPAFMKKNRPGYQLNVICSRDDLGRLETIIFRETTTIGIRVQEMERAVLSRKKEVVSTPFGPVEVKLCSGYGVVKAYPEYESTAKISREKGVSFAEVFEAAQAACKNLLNK